jgi:ribosome-binding protein aMBF1 (putative translation factor)
MEIDMVNADRIFGENVYRLMVKKGLNSNLLATALGYEADEVRKIFDARIFLDDEERKNIARVLDTTVENLYNNEELEAEGNYMEYRGNFTSQDNKKLILDMFDAYCDIQEILIEEGIKPSC